MTAREEERFAEKLTRQCGEWKGVLSVVTGRDDDFKEQREFPVSVRLDDYSSDEGKGRRIGGVMTLIVEQEGAAPNYVDIPLSFSVDKMFGGSGSVGDHKEALYAASAPETGDLIDRERILWVGQNSRFEMQVTGETKMDMVISGVFDLPRSIFPEPAVWVLGHLKREGFRVAIGSLFEITLMECLGIFATLFFASRFIVQWAASEKAGRSVVPEFFWWISLFGGLSMIIYAIYFGRFAVLLGQLTGWIVYARNIWLIHREKRQVRNEVAQASENA